jgi:hypothetical protein
MFNQLITNTMKKKVFMAMMAMTIGVACNASALGTSYSVTDEPEKSIVMDTISEYHHHEDHEIDGAPCPCSNYSCTECGGKLEYSATAYKKYTGKKCSICKGEGCKTCGNEGLEWWWVPGCYCKMCKIGYVQPNDC